MTMRILSYFEVPDGEFRENNIQQLRDTISSRRKAPTSCAVVADHELFGQKVRS